MILVNFVNVPCGSEPTGWDGDGLGLDRQPVSLSLPCSKPTVWDGDKNL